MCFVFEYHIFIVFIIKSERKLRPKSSFEHLCWKHSQGAVAAYLSSNFDFATGNLILVDLGTNWVSKNKNNNVTNCTLHNRNKSNIM